MLFALAIVGAIVIGCLAAIGLGGVILTLKKGTD